MVGGNVPNSLEHLFVSIQSFNSKDLCEITTEDYYDFIIVDTKQNILFQYNSNDDWFHNLISLKKFYNQEVITIYKKENHFYISIDF